MPIIPKNRTQEVYYLYLMPLWVQQKTMVSGCMVGSVHLKLGITIFLPHAQIRVSFIWVKMIRKPTKERLFHKWVLLAKMNMISMTIKSHDIPYVIHGLVFTKRSYRLKQTAFICRFFKYVWAFCGHNSKAQNLLKTLQNSSAFYDLV